MSATTLDITQVGADVADGAIPYNVAASATLMYPGEPVVRALGGTVVTPMPTNAPVIGTNFVVGIATTTSTNTAAAAGHVYVQPLLPGQIFAISPKVAATWDTQSEYDALTGKRVLIDLTTGAYTILAVDGATFGCIVMAKNVKFDLPGKVYFSFKWAACDMYAAG